MTFDDFISDFIAFLIFLKLFRKIMIFIFSKWKIIYKYFKYFK